MTTIAGMKPHFEVASRQLQKISFFIQTETDNMTFASYQNCSSEWRLMLTSMATSWNGMIRQHRIWIGSAYNAFARFLFRVSIRDTDCDFRLIRRTALDDIQLISTSGMTA